jgi:metal-responsive CopG/Arc/MetJ family transcriptional regulator
MPKKTLRTTIAIKREHQVLLRALAAKRGFRGYSKIIAEALDLYLKERAEEVKEILRKKGV